MVDLLQEAGKIDEELVHQFGEMVHQVRFHFMR
jgi:hypothetical protein